MDVKNESIARDFATAINRHSRENDSNTPDFILAEYLVNALEAYERIHNVNEKWYGKELCIGSGQFVSWETLTDQNHHKTPTEQVLLACITALTNHFDWQHSTPWEIYEAMVNRAIEMFIDAPDLPDKGGAE
jgi:hypothetical protein